MRRIGHGSTGLLKILMLGLLDSQETTVLMKIVQEFTSIRSGMISTVCSRMITSVREISELNPGLDLDLHRVCSPSLKKLNTTSPITRLVGIAHDALALPKAWNWLKSSMIKKTLK
jgi:hypothetical protein